MKRSAVVALVLGLLAGAMMPAFGTVSAHFGYGFTMSGDAKFYIDTCRDTPFNTTSFYYSAKNAAAHISAVSGSTFDYIAAAR